MPPFVFADPASPSPSVAPRTTLRLKRLSARAFNEDDWPLILKLQTDPRSGPWLRGARPVAAEARSRAIAFAFAENWRRDGYGPHLLLLDDTPIGYAGVRRS
ncbi:MAG: GNAT family N-acetyltransferase, partial [Rhodobacteraceae bacterium]|nr:GNAT family N-acetyltransferase [Paracoccaceae bacterium]